MKHTLLILVAAAAAWAQPAALPKPVELAPGEVLRVVDVTKGSATAIQTNLAALFPGITRVGDQLIVRGQPPVVDMIEAAIKKLDVPSPESRPAPNVELTVQLVLASAQEGPAAPVPASLQPTVRQLQGLFPYKSYRILETQVLRSAVGGRRQEVAGILPGTESQYFLSLRTSLGPGPAPRAVRLSDFQFTLQQESIRAQILTEMDALEGQSTVVGKANLRSSDDAIFLVITPKVIE